MAVPSRFVGVWRRIGLGVADGPVVPDGDVLWLQAGECFADLRTGGSELRGFAGRASWDAPLMTWSAEVEVPESPGPQLPDVGELTGEGDLLVERGTWLTDGRPERYVEHWRRVGGRGPLVALSRGVDRFLAVAGFAVLITTTGGRRWQRDGGNWTVAATVGEVTEAEPPRAGGGWVDSR